MEYRDKENRMLLKKAQEKRAHDLEMQVNLKAQRAAFEDAAQQQEVAAMKDQWRKQEEQAKAAEHEVQLKKKLLRQEYEEFSRQKQVQKAAAKAAEKAEDAQLLSAALIKESKIAAAEDAHKTLLSTAQRQYREEVLASMQKHAAEDGAQDAAIAQEARHQAQRWQAETEKREVSRAELMADMLKGRQEQIDNRKKQRHQDAMESMMERTASAAAARQAEEDRCTAVAAKQEKARLYNQDLQAQIAEKQKDKGRRR